MPSPSSSVDKTKVMVILAGVIILACAIWIGSFIFGSGALSGPVEPQFTATTKAVMEFNAGLTLDKRYSNAGLEVVSEEPLKLKIIGMVDTDADFTDLQKKAAEAFQGADIDYDIEVKPR